MMDDAPERIWAFHAGPMVGLFVGKSEQGRNVAEYVRVDVARTELEAAVLAEREARAMIKTKGYPMSELSLHTIDRQDGDQIQDQPSCILCDDIPEAGRPNGWREDFADSPYSVVTQGWKTLYPLISTQIHIGKTPFMLT